MSTNLTDRPLKYVKGSPGNTPHAFLSDFHVERTDPCGRGSQCPVACPGDIDRSERNGPKCAVLPPRRGRRHVVSIRSPATTSSSSRCGGRGSADVDSGTDTERFLPHVRRRKRLRGLLPAAPIFLETTQPPILVVAHHALVVGGVCHPLRVGTSRHIEPVLCPGRRPLVLELFPAVRFRRGLLGSSVLPRGPQLPRVRQGTSSSFFAV